MKIFFTNKAVFNDKLRDLVFFFVMFFVGFCRFCMVWLWVFMSIVQRYNPVLAVFMISASIRQGYCQMDLNSERIYVKSKNADVGGHRVREWTHKG